MFVKCFMQSTDNERVILLPPTLGNKLGTLFLSFFVMIVVVSFISAGAGSFISDKRSAFLVSSLFQSLLAFMFPAWLTARLCSDKPNVYIGLNTHTCLRQYCGVMLFLVVMTPLMNAIVDWNENITLPAFMEGIGKIFRQWEDAAAKTTVLILNDSSWWGLVSGVIVVGCVTGFAEEMFFPAGLQNALTSSGLNHHAAVWLTAFVFSTVHFQFFGFVPRMLLGAFFGYIYNYTGSIWTSTFAHALNNASVVVFSWLLARGYIAFQIDSFGTSGDYSWIVVASSLIITTVAFIFLWKRLMHQPLESGMQSRNLQNH